MAMLKKLILPDAERALPGRADPMPVPEKHYVTGELMQQPLPVGCEQVLLGMGCFWGVEKLFWDMPGIKLTAVGYAAGITPNPSYEEVCSGDTGHNEVVRLYYDASVAGLVDILKVFWEQHVPTLGMRQGNDVGTQYRSGIYVYNDSQYDEAEESRAAYQLALWQKGLGGITTEIRRDVTFYFAEDYHQQYLAKNPGGYCNHLDIGKTGFPAFPG